MSKENVKAFMDKLATDKDLQAKVNDRARAVEAVIIPAAKEAGFEFTIEELKEYEADNSGKVSKEELGAVAGGHLPPRCIMQGMPNPFSCPLGIPNPHSQPCPLGMPNPFSERG